MAVSRPGPWSRHSWVFLLPELAIDELVALDALPGVEVDDRGHQHPLLVGAAGVDRKDLAELHRALALVDVAVQREDRLVRVDRSPDRLRAHRPEGSAAVHQLQVAVDGGRLVEPRLEGRRMEVE